MTKRQIERIAKENNVNMGRISIRKVHGLWNISMAEIPNELIEKNLASENETNIPEIDRLIRRYNRQAMRLVKIFPMEFHGFRAGDGVWEYEEGPRTQGEILASLNID